MREEGESMVEKMFKEIKSDFTASTGAPLEQPEGELLCCGDLKAGITSKMDVYLKLDGLYFLMDPGTAIEYAETIIDIAETAEKRRKKRK